MWAIILTSGCRFHSHNAPWLFLNISCPHYFHVWLPRATPPLVAADSRSPPTLVSVLYTASGFSCIRPELVLVPLGQKMLAALIKPYSVKRKVELLTLSSRIHFQAMDDERPKDPPTDGEQEGPWHFQGHLSRRDNAASARRTSKGAIITIR